MIPQSPFQPFAQRAATSTAASSLSISPMQPQLLSTNESNSLPDALLFLYRHNMAPPFPFFIVPNGIAAAKLAHDKPFLYEVLLMVASYHDKLGQVKMVKEIFQHVSARIIVENGRTFDLF